MNKTLIQDNHRRLVLKKRKKKNINYHKADEHKKKL